MKTHPNELFLYYNCESDTHKKTRALAHSIANHVNETTFKNEAISKTMWADLLSMLNLKPKDLLDKSDTKYQAELAGHNFNEEDWLNILINNPCMIKAPIAVMQNKAILCLSPQDIFKLVREKNTEFAENG